MSDKEATARIKLNNLANRREMAQISLSKFPISLVPGIEQKKLRKSMFVLD
jgi:hypothetical protein